MKPVFRAICYALILLASASKAIACRCGPEITPRAAYERAETVVLARVEEVKNRPDQNGVTARLTVARAWKKPVSREIAVLSTTTCAFNFERGQQYILYIFRGSDRQLHTSQCLGNVPVSDAGKVRAWLDRYGVSAAVN